MRFKRIFMLICLLVCLFAMASVCAGEANDTEIYSENSLEINQPADEVVCMDDKAELALPQSDEILTSNWLSFQQLNDAINDNNESEINLTGDYRWAYEEDLESGIVISRDLIVNGNGHIIDGNKDARIFYVAGGNVVFKNITFKNAFFLEEGGAIYGGSAVNCTFINNTGLMGGAIYEGSARDCTFVGNTADLGAGGAIFRGSAINCTFIDNTATYEGGAIYEGSAVNCTFSGNSAQYYGNAMMKGYRLNCIAQSDDDYYKTENMLLFWDVDNFTAEYGSGKTLPIKLRNQKNDLIGLIDYDVVVQEKDVEIRRYHCLSNDDLALDLEVGSYVARIVATYPGLEQTAAKNITLKVTKKAPKIEVAASDVTYPDEVVVTVRSDVSGEYIVKVAGMAKNVTLVAGEARNVTFSGLAANENGYIVNVTHESENYSGVNDTILVKVKKASTVLSADAVTATYNINEDLTITLKDAKGNPVSGADVAVDFNGAKTFATIIDGQVKVSTVGLAPKTYDVKITFEGNANYLGSSASAKLTVRKADLKITAKKKTYRADKKTKKFTITLKDNAGKPIKNAKVRLMVKKIAKQSKKKSSKKSKSDRKKNFAKTNNKGKATFKVLK
uniref:pectate lyase-like adhesive domain-containing protein n=1 Tax=Methanobrevibacter sp. TaxID=66852 RepID=UPI00386B1052